MSGPCRAAKATRANDLPKSRRVLDQWAKAGDDPAM